MATLVKLRALTADERTELKRLARSRTQEAQLVVRARVMLGLAGGEWPYQVADRAGVRRSHGRYRADGPPGGRSLREKGSNLQPAG